MKIAVLSDIHGNSVALKKVIEDIQSRKIEEAILLGDYLYKGPDPIGVLNILKNMKLSICIKGNTDQFITEIDMSCVPNNDREKMLFDFCIYMTGKLSSDDIEYIKSLPESKSILVEKINILCVHGSPRRINEAINPDFSDDELSTVLEGIDERIILCGHSHQQFIRQVGEKVIVNPGAVGLCNMDEDDRAAYAVIEIIDDRFNVEMVKVTYSHLEIIDFGYKFNFPHLEVYADMLKNF